MKTSSIYRKPEKCLLLVSLVFIFLPGCKKKKDTGVTVIPPFSKLIASMQLFSDTGLVTTTHYTYDGHNRLVQELSSTENTTYGYGGNSVVMQYKSFTYGTSGTITYSLSGGNAVSSTDGTGSQPAYTVGLFTYNSANFLLEAHYQSGVHSSQSGTYFYTNADCDSVIYTATMDIPYSYYYWYTGFKNTLGNANRGIFFLGCDNAHLLAKQYYIFMEDTVYTQYTYEFNADSTVSKRHYTQFQNGMTKNFTEVYTYSDAH